MEFPRKAKNGLFDNKVSRVCGKNLFFLVQSRALGHVTCMCPELQRSNKWGQPPGTGLNSRQRLGTCSALHSGDEGMRNDISHSCFYVWLITLADKGSPLSLQGANKQAGLRPHTSPELDVALLIHRVMWGGWRSPHRIWMFCKRDEGVESAQFQVAQLEWGDWNWMQFVPLRQLSLKHHCKLIDMQIGCLWMFFILANLLANWCQRGRNQIKWHHSHLIHVFVGWYFFSFGWQTRKQNKIIPNIFSCCSAMVTHYMKTWCMTNFFS